MEVGVDTLVEVGVDTLEDVDAEDDVDTELDVDTLKTKRKIITTFIFETVFYEINNMPF